MRKTVCFVIAAFMCFMPVRGMANAEEVARTEVMTEDETEDSATITFRNMPWGITYGEVLDSYNEFNLNINAEPYISKYLVAPLDEKTKINVYGNGFSVADDNGAGFEVGAGNYSDVVCTVAGYDVKRIKYGFIFSIDKTTGYVDSDIRNAYMYYGEYSFSDMNDATAMTEDLVSKLSSLYGDLSETDSSSYSNGDVRNYYMWEDISGNWIVLQHEVKTDEPDSVTIGYYCGQSFEWMDQINTAYNKAEAENFVAPSGTDGL